MSVHRGLWFLCTFALPAASFAQVSTPEALRDDITIERVAPLAPRAIRMARDPVSGILHYISYEGDLFELKPAESGEMESVEIATAADHGITRLQGMAFRDSTLYLLGNVKVNNDKGTRGRLVRGRRNGSGGRTWTVMFVSDEIGSVKTAFDHGFNGIAVSVDGQYLYINSGARTDHGEVQDNDGAYPGARDEPLTAAILRIPADAENLLLRNDMEELTEKGYIFARGIRNAFDLDFSPAGHLFAVSNSGDYDHPEDMFWVREGRHYGFPWVMGGIENPQQFPDFQPDTEKDPFLNPYSHAYSRGYFSNDPDFPKRPPDMVISHAVANVGPDANYYRDRKTGAVRKADDEGIALGTFTAHRSLLGLTFDVDSLVGGGMQGDGFVLSWTNGERSTLMRRLEPEGGSDLLHLKLFYSPDLDNYIVQTRRIADGFTGPIDALLEGNVMYVMEHGGKDASMWKLTLPAASDPAATRQIQPSHQHNSAEKDG